MEIGQNQEVQVVDIHSLPDWISLSFHKQQQVEKKSNNLHYSFIWIWFNDDKKLYKHLTFSVSHGVISISINIYIYITISFCPFIIFVFVFVFLFHLINDFFRDSFVQKWRIIGLNRTFYVWMLFSYDWASNDNMHLHVFNTEFPLQFLVQCSSFISTTFYEITWEIWFLWFTKKWTYKE